jgi:glycosyltransferase involved in cell wall biosynthesis
MNPLKSFFKKNAAPSTAAEPFAPSSSSPRYAYAFQSPFKQPRILILVDHVRATYFLSFHYVLERLHRDESLAFFVIDSGEIERWSQGQASNAPEAFVEQVIADVQPTIVIFSRYGLPYGDRLLELFKAKQVATISHFDDDLLNINPALGEEIQKRHGDALVQKARQVLLAQSDLIYASTAFLAERYGTQFPEQSVFNGIYAPYLDFLLTQKPNPNKSPLTIGYMGSQGHQADLDAIAPAIAQVLERNPNLRFETFGTIAIPSALQAFDARVKAHPTRPDYAEFLNQLAQLNWAIGLAPLNDTEFNRCKAPTKYIEYTTCGIATLASSGNVYAQFPPNSHIVIAQPTEWADKIQQLIDNSALRESLVANAQAYCAQTFSLNVLESQIKELIALV